MNEHARNDDDDSGPLEAYGKALERVMRQAMQGWKAADPEDYAESEAKIGRGELRMVLTTMVGPHAPAELAFGVIDGEGALRITSRMVLPKFN
jgi:hypothetical protein